MRLIILTFILAAIVSCGRQYGEDEKTSSISFSTVGNVEAAKELTSDEQSIAQRICYAFKNKRTSFSVERLGDKFQYTVKNTQCDQSSTSQSIEATLSKDLSTQKLSLDSSTSLTYFSKVQTDVDGLLTDICSTAFNNGTLLQFEINGSSVTEFIFAQSGTTDIVTVRQGTTTSNGSGYTPSVISRFEVSTSNGANQGIVTKTEQFIPCSGDSDNNLIFEQVLNP